MLPPLKQKVAALFFSFLFFIEHVQPGSANSDEEPEGECGEPDFSHLDILGLGRGAKYDDKVFHYDDGSYIASGENIRKATKAKLRAPG